MKRDVTFLGTVRRVVGAKVYIEICSSVPSASPIINGRTYRVGQVGSFVRIPLGFLNVYGAVSLVGASEISDTGERIPGVKEGQRWIEVQLVGESYAHGKFQRGISVFPTIDDEAHIVTEADLTIIYGNLEGAMVEIGTHVASDGLRAFVDLDKLISRHGAVVGSTGCGKSNTIASLLKSLTEGSYPNARIIVVDPHGEYHAAFPDRSRVFRINDASSPLYIPYWALSFDELAWFLYDRRSSGESSQDATIRERIYEEKKAVCGSLCAGSIPADEITADSPIPFKLRELFFELYEKEYATLRTKDDWTTIAYKTEAGRELRANIASLTLPQYEPPGAGSLSPFKNLKPPGVASILNKIYGRLKDRRFSFLLDPSDYDGITKDLNHLVDDWLNHDKPITIFDFGGIPFEVMDLVVGVLVRILFEGMFWGRDLPGMGKQRPILVVFEEAHAYLPRGTTSQFVAGYACRSVRRIFKEGRKYGIGALVVSQRPSELDDTILSQCGTFVALRLTNGEDQGRVRATVPDALAGLMEILPALRTGEAIVVGEAMQVPSRIRLPLVEPRPNSSDPEIADRWAESPVVSPAYDTAVTGWRRQQMAPAPVEPAPAAAAEEMTVVEDKTNKKAPLAAATITQSE